MAFGGTIAGLSLASSSRLSLVPRRQLGCCGRARAALKGPPPSAVLAQTGLSSGEVAGGRTPFSGWAVNVRGLDGVDLNAILVPRVHGSRLP